MVAGLETQRSEAEKRFSADRESDGSLQNLEEKFKEAMQRAEKSTEKHVNPFDSIELEYER